MIDPIPACAVFGSVEITPVRVVGSGRESPMSSFRRVADMVPRRWDLRWTNLSESRARDGIRAHFRSAFGSVLPFPLTVPGPETVTVRYVSGTMSISFSGANMGEATATVEEALAV